MNRRVRLTVGLGHIALLPPTDEDADHTDSDKGEADNDGHGPLEPANGICARIRQLADLIKRVVPSASVQAAVHGKELGKSEPSEQATDRQHDDTNDTDTLWTHVP
jgi:hypothetical protein